MIIQSCTVCHHIHGHVCDCGCSWEGREDIYVPEPELAYRKSVFTTMRDFIRFLRMDKGK